MLSASIKYNPGPLTANLRQFVAELAQEVLVTAKKNTPVKTGHARRHWTKTVTDKRAVINNKVPYIQRLEAGASRQAPNGILQPTLTQVKGKYR